MSEEFTSFQQELMDAALGFAYSFRQGAILRSRDHNEWNRKDLEASDEATELDKAKFKALVLRAQEIKQSDNPMADKNNMAQLRFQHE